MLHCTVIHCCTRHCIAPYFTLLYSVLLYPPPPPPPLPAPLNYTTLHFIVLKCAVPYRVVLYCILLHCTTLHCSALDYITLHYSVLTYTVICCNILYIVLYRTVLYYTDAIMFNEITCFTNMKLAKSDLVRHVKLILVVRWMRIYHMTVIAWIPSLLVEMPYDIICCTWKKHHATFIYCYTLSILHSVHSIWSIELLFNGNCMHINLITRATDISTDRVYLASSFIGVIELEDSWILYA